MTRFLDLVRPAAGTALLSEWLIGTAERSRTAANALMNEWAAAETPSGRLAQHVFLSTESAWWLAVRRHSARRASVSRMRCQAGVASSTRREKTSCGCPDGLLSRSHAISHASRSSMSRSTRGSSGSQSTDRSHARYRRIISRPSKLAFFSRTRCGTASGSRACSRNHESRSSRTLRSLPPRGRIRFITATATATATTAAGRTSSSPLVSSAIRRRYSVSSSVLRCNARRCR